MLAALTGYGPFLYRGIRVSMVVEYMDNGDEYLMIRIVL